MRPEIADAYERMQNRKPDVEFQPLPERKASQAQGGIAGTSRTGVVSTSDDDFDFAGKMTPKRAAGGDFELGASFTSAVPDERKAGVSAFSGGKRKGHGAEPEPEPAAPAEAATAVSSEAASEAKTEKSAKRKPPVDEGGEAHSTATAGDALLQVALQEEKEAERRGFKRKPGFDPVRVSDGWMITCPCPAKVRIKVKEAHRGKTGKCPNPSCGSYFTVPADLPMDEAPQAATSEAAALEAASGFPADPADKAGPYTHWLRDVRLHVIKPAKAKRKPGGHEKDFQLADLGFAKDAGIAVLSLASKAAGMLAKPKKPEQVREDLLAELRGGKAVAESSALAKFTFEPGVLGKLIVEYPPAYEHESTFAGIPVFGEGRIAVKLPPAGAPDEQHFVSLTLTQYRRLQQLLDGLFEIQAFGVGCPIPREEDVVHLVCHYSEDKLTILRNPAFHRADPETPLEAVGYRCESCGLIVSEASRRKEKIGGLEGKKLAGAKCPKCKGRFGNSPLYAVKPKEAAPTAEATAAEPAKTEAAPEAAADAASEKPAS
jgi:hypothetical protein